MTKRGEVISRAVRLVAWVQRQRGPFTVHAVHDVSEGDIRSAYRWLNALEANGIIERHGTDRNDGGQPVTAWRRA